MVTVSSNFMWSFKTGDNINHNLRLLALLNEFYEQGNSTQKRLLCKPIILILVSIIEAVLHDFHMRIKRHKLESIVGLATTVIDYVREMQLKDELEKYIASARKHNFFKMTDMKFYDRLDDLRRLRNRIHIQNTKNNFEVDEYKAFNDARKIMAEKVLEKTLKTLTEKYPRTGKRIGLVTDFKLPWTEYFPGNALKS